MTFELNQKIFACKVPGRKWRKTKYGAFHTVSWLHCNAWNEIVSVNCIIRIDPLEDPLKRYPNGFGMGHDADFGAGLKESRRHGEQDSPWTGKR
eukprot:8406516-Ditylum_brightwellii.AAC.1